MTGASRGLGRATALALAEEGVALVVSARTASDLSRIADSVDVDVECVSGDMNDPDLPDALVERAIRRFGRLDIVVGNNAGPAPAGPFDVTDDELIAAVNANALSSIRLARAARGPMLDGGWGRMCFIASGSARQPMEDLTLSNVARPALWGWAKTASDELAGTGVTVNLLCPGLHSTDRAVELGRHRPYIGDPAAFGRVVAFACSTHTAFMTGTALVIDGGRIRGL